jgi:hypothetical protein
MQKEPNNGRKRESIERLKASIKETKRLQSEINQNLADMDRLLKEVSDKRKKLSKQKKSN